MLLSILAFSSLITLLVTSFDLYLEYRLGVSTIKDRLHQIELSYAAPLGESLWNLDKRQIELLLRSIADLPDIRSVEVSETILGSRVHFAVVKDATTTDAGEWRDIPISCNCGGSIRQIGVLHVEATHTNLYRGITQHALVLLAGQTVKTFLVATFILFVVHRLVTRHLLDLAGAMARFHPGAVRPMAIRRHGSGQGDELDQVVVTFNAMSERLERHAAEIGAANARMAAILDNIPDLAWVKDGDGHYIAANRKLANTLGLADPAHMVGKSDFDFSPPQIAEGYRRDDLAVIQSGETLRTDETHVRADGSLFRIETIKSPLSSPTGEIIGTVGIARDVSERRRMEEAMRETATRLEALIANVKATLFRSTCSVTGPRLTMKAYGQSVSTELAAAINSMPLAELRLKFFPDDQDREFDAIGIELGLHGYIEHICRYVARNGDIRSLLLRERVIAREGDSLVTEGFALDVSEEVSIRRRLEAFIRHLPGTIFRLHYPIDGPKQLVFADGASNLSRRLVALPPEEYMQAFHPDDRERLFVELPKLLREKGEVTHLLRVRGPDGTWRWVRAWERVVERYGDEMFTEGISLDVTDEMIAKQALEASELEFRTLVENSPNMVIRYDRDCRRTYVNPAYEDATGISRSDALSGVPDWGNSDPSQAEYGAKLRQVIETGQPAALVVGWTRPDGTAVAHDVHLVPDRDLDGQIVGVLVIGHDITLQKRSERRLQALIDNLPGRMYRITRRSDGMRHVAYTGGTGPDLLGIEAEPDRWWPNSEPTPYISAEYWPQLQAEITHQLDERGAFQIRYPVEVPDMGRRWVMSRAKVVKRTDDITVIEGLLLDITEEMEAKQAVETSERRYRELVDALPVGVLTIDTDGRVVLFNDAAVNILGRQLRAGEMPGQGSECGFWPDGSPISIADCPLQTAIRENRAARDVEMIFARPNEQRIHVLGYPTPTHDGSGATTGGIMALVDISERKRTELALERVNRVLRTLGASNDALVHSTDEDELFQRTCDAIVSVGGYRMAWVGLAEDDPQKTVRPVSWAGVEEGYLASTSVSWADVPTGRGPTGTAIRTGMVQVNRNTAFNTKMAPWRYMALDRGYRSSISLPLNGKSRTFGCLSIYSGDLDAFGPDESSLFVDLANNLAYGVRAMRERRLREEIERHLHQAQKMEALGQLAGSVAHDFNNLLGAILGFARFIVEDTDPGHPSRGHAARILSAGRRGKALVGQILSFARRGEMTRERFAVADLMTETQALLHATIPATTQVLLDCATDAEVDGDRDQLTQILLNLGINAHDSFGGKSGTVTITVHPTSADSMAFSRAPHRQVSDPEASSSLSVWEDDHGVAHAQVGTVDLRHAHVSIVVSDCGCGMNAKVLEKVFAPFFTTKSKGQGTGLGLAMTHGVVLAHGGALLVTSQPGRGSSFQVILPCATDPAPSPEEKDRPAPLPALVPAHVLLIDDDLDFGEMLLSALERAGFEVSPCSDPKEALEGVRDHAEFWDVVVTDQTMPGMTGMDLIREIKAIRPDLPCVLCTGYAQNALDERSLAEVGAFALLRKPIDIDDLIETVARATAASRKPDAE
ncbi:MAG TPA: PAS domain S-box protein [Magnetospirillum sp.]|nr:PAS domain S-box protein [Magnetospirillum sp.]